MNRKEHKERIQKIEENLKRLQEKNALQNETAEFLDKEGERLLAVADNEKLSMEERVSAWESAHVILKKMELNSNLKNPKKNSKLLLDNL